MVFKRNLWAVSMMAAIATLTQSTYAQAESLSADNEKSRLLSSITALKIQQVFEIP